MWSDDRTRESDLYAKWLEKYKPKKTLLASVLNGEKVAQYHGGDSIPVAKHHTCNATIGEQRVIVEFCCSKNSFFGRGL